MDRTACVDLPAFPLQLLLRRHADWAEHPAAVVDRDRPQGVLLWVNERARAQRILPGMRYAAGLALAGDLRAAEVAPAEVDRAVRGVAKALRAHTPFVEPAEGEPGVFWLDASGLERLHASIGAWADRVRDDLTARGFRVTLVVGFTRFGTYALAKAKRGRIVLAQPRDEAGAARRVPLDRLAFPPAERDALDRVGVRTVGDLAALPEDGLETRFGKDLLRLHRLAAGAVGVPLQPDLPEEPAVRSAPLDHAETDALRLFGEIERLLHPLLRLLAERRQAAAEVRLQLRFGSRTVEDRVETIRPAAPTLSAGQLLDLIGLRLQSMERLRAGVEEVALAARGVPAAPRQLELFAETPRRDLAAANRALARVRAELGDAAVVRARLRDGHLPEARFRWEPLDALGPADPRPADAGRLIRRAYGRPVPLPPRPRQEPDGWMLRGLTDAPVIRTSGPYVVSGGWWRRAVHREYLFAETQDGDLLWVYYDRHRRRWFLHGRVE